MPLNTIETEHLLIRPFTMDDVDDVHREIYSSPEVWGPKTREEVADGVLVAVLRGSSEWQKRAAVLKADGTFLGQVCLVPFHNYFYRWEEEADPPFNSMEVELNFAFGKQYWGNSYAYEAGMAMILHAFNVLKLPRLIGGTGADNLRSIKLHTRLGYQVFPALPVEGQEYSPGVVAVLKNLRHRQ